MERIFKNKKLAYFLVGVLSALQLAQSIMKWSDGRFDGGSLILCVLMIGLLIVAAVGINKKNNALMLISATTIIGVTSYKLINRYSGSFIDAIQNGTINASIAIWFTFLCLGILLLLASLVLAIIKAFGVKKDLRLLNSIFCLLSTICAIVAFIMPFVGGETITNKIPGSIFVMVLPLLIACVGYHIEIKE